MTQTQENDKKNGWTDGRTDRQTAADESDFIGRCTTNV